MADGEVDSLSRLLDPFYIGEQILIVHTQMRDQLDRWSKKRQPGQSPRAKGGPFEQIYRPAIDKYMTVIDYFAENAFLELLETFEGVGAIAESW